jgi:hypothetical protein
VHLELRLPAERVEQSGFDQIDGQMREVDPDPASVQLLGGVDGGAAAVDIVGPCNPEDIDCN